MWDFTSAAVDAWDWVQAECGARQALQRAILLERICELDDARHVLAVVGEVVAAQAVSTSRETATLLAANSCLRLITRA